MSEEINHNVHVQPHYVINQRFLTLDVKSLSMVVL